MEIDTDKVEQLLHFGYPEKYVYEALQDSQANYVTAGYYLLQMDQNYCWYVSIANINKTF